MNSGNKRTEKKILEKFKVIAEVNLIKHINLIQLAVINAIQRLKLINSCWKGKRSLKKIFQPSTNDS
jgi:hypothetical protein